MSMRNPRKKPAPVAKTARPGSGRWRIVVVAVLFGLTWVALWARAGQVQLVQGEELAEKARRQHVMGSFERGERGDILDRNGRSLARSVRFNSVYVRPGEVENLDAMIRHLAEVLRQPVGELRQKLVRSRDFVWVARQIDDRAAAVLAERKFKGVYLTPEFGRLYPNNHLAGQVLGFAGVDDNGLEGVERSMDSVLAGGRADFLVQRDASGNRLYLDDQGREVNIRGRDVVLTLDAHIQDLAETALARSVEHFNGRAGVCVVVDVASGEILALAHYPFFNPNVYRRQNADLWRNRAAMDIFEPGSTFKPFLVAAALQEKKITPQSRYYCENGRWKLGRHTIRDDIHAYEWLTVDEIMRYSSNIGSAKIGLELGAKRYASYLSRLGFGERPGLALPGASKGLMRAPEKWREMDIAAISFGQGIGVTVLQMARAFLCLANDGVTRELKLVKSPIVSESEPGERVFDEDVARAVRRMMVDVVHKDGTGVRARIDGLVVGGKTGTAQKPLPEGGYGRNYISSFVGFYPGDKPKYLILALVDDPSRAFYGSTVALPVVHDVALGALAYACELPGQDNAPVELAALAVPSNEVSARVVREAQPVPEGKVPDLRGLPLRKAVEILVRQGVVPLVEGNGAVVAGQSPTPGTAWPKAAQPFTLRLKGHAES